MGVEFAELNGSLRPGGFASASAPAPASPRPSSLVVLSNLSGGAAETRPQTGIGIKFVAAGEEIYRFGGRTHHARPGYFLLVPEQQRGDVAIGRAETRALGMCVFLPPLPSLGRVAPGLEAPMAFPSECSRLGRALQRTMQDMRRAPHLRPHLARRLVEGITSDVEDLLCDAQRQLDGIEAVKASTRLEILRRVNLARAYLHSVTDRPVDLAELAGAVAVSRFQLLRQFRDLVGESPALYHRRLRLDLARHEVARGAGSASEIAHRFGFADASSFSHAYRRTFGEAPFRGGKPEAA